MLQRHALIDFALVATVMGLIYVGLQPFAFSPPNRVGQDSSGQGLEFDPPAMAISESALVWDDRLSEPEITIHLWLKSDHPGSNQFGVVLSLLDESETPPLVIAQWRDGLNLRVRAPNARGYWEIGAPGSLASNGRHLITVTSSVKKGSQIYIDGKQRTQSSRTIHLAPDRKLGGRLLVGSQRDGAAGWAGTLFGLAIQNKAVTSQAVAAFDRTLRKDPVDGFSAALKDSHSLEALYLFSALNDHRIANVAFPSRAGALLVPAVFSVPRSSVFIVPEWSDLKRPWFQIDLLRNIAGFIPLGLLAWLSFDRRRKMSRAAAAINIVLLGLALSVAIETIQILLPDRTSSFVDILGNTLGTGAGVILILGLRLRQSTSETG